jgi:acetyl esterase/lipase
MKNVGLVPKAEYPVPLKQTIATVKHLIDAGYHPEDIHLVGDSAGAALILQVLSHMLHPIQGITELTLSSKLGGVILISPWVTLDTNSPSFTSNSTTDIFPPQFYSHLASFIKPSVPEFQKPYVEAVKAPKGWFKGIDGVVSRVFITVGDAECLRDDIETFANDFTAVHKQAKVVKIPGGTHNEPFGTVIAGDPDIGEWPSRFADWLL